MRVAPIGERGNHRSGLVPGDKGEAAMNTVQQRQHLATTVRRALAGIAIGLLAQAGSPATARAQYAFTTLDMPGSEATYADGNSVGRIVGEFDDADGNTHGFIRSRGGVFT